MVEFLNYCCIALRVKSMFDESPEFPSLFVILQNLKLKC